VSEPTQDPAPSQSSNERDAEETKSGSALAQWAFYLGWFVAAPVAVAFSRVFILAAFPETALIETLRGQPIPVSIVLFTFTIMLLWGQRWHLPGAEAAGVGGRRGLPGAVRRKFDHARALREEARAILRAHSREIERTLREETRAEIERTIEELTAAMDAASFDEPRFEAALDRATTLVDERLGRWRKSEAREYAESIFVAIGVALAIRAFVIEAFKIPSGSMIPTLLVGDHIFVNKLAYGPLLPFSKKRVWTSMPPHRGDVIVFAFPENPEDDFIKRVIALPGDKLEVRDGRVWLNDRPIPRCYVGRTSYLDMPDPGSPANAPIGTTDGDLYVEYLGGQSYLTFYSLASMTASNAGPWFPKPGEAYVLGDNRNNSRDSREWWGRKGGGVPFENIRGRALWIWFFTGGDGTKLSRFGTSVMGRPRLPDSMKAMQPNLEKCLGDHPPIDPQGALPMP
jgi:signal peptidase I